jgi:hypothetical protein
VSVRSSDTIEHGNSSDQPLTQFRWRAESVNEYTSSLSLKLQDYTVTEMCEDLLSGVENATQTLSRILMECAVKNNGKKLYMKNSDWYDNECKVLKKSKFQALRNFQLTEDGNMLTIFKEIRNSYRCLCRTKKKAYEEQYISKIVHLCNNQKSFWAEIKRLNRSNMSQVASISTEDWINYFQDIYNMTDIVNDYNHMENASQFVDNHCADTCVTCKSDEINDILNGRITDDEIETAITNLQCGT